MDTTDVIKKLKEVMELSDFYSYDDEPKHHIKQLKKELKRRRKNYREKR